MIVGRTPSATNAESSPSPRTSLIEANASGSHATSPSVVGTQPELPRRIGLGSESWMQPALNALPHWNAPVCLEMTIFAAEPSSEVNVSWPVDADSPASASAAEGATRAAARTRSRGRIRGIGRASQRAEAGSPVAPPRSHGGNPTTFVGDPYIRRYEAP